MSRVAPPAPERRSKGAEVAAPKPPPMSRKSTCRSAISGDASATGRELRRDLRLEPWIEDQQDLIAGIDHRVALGHEAGAAAQHRDDQRAVGQRHVLDPAAG